jgi:hypothetical protein
MHGDRFGALFGDASLQLLGFFVALVCKTKEGGDDFIILKRARKMAVSCGQSFEQLRIFFHRNSTRLDIDRHGQRFASVIDADPEKT